MEGITQEELALESGLSQGYINQLENGKRRYTQKCLELIAEALSVHMVELFKEEEKRHHVSVARKEFNIYKTRHPSKKRIYCFNRRTSRTYCEALLYPHVNGKGDMAEEVVYPGFEDLRKYW